MLQPIFSTTQVIDQQAMTRFLSLALLVAVFAPIFSASSPLQRRAVSPTNPTGVHVSYSLGWLNRDSGNFGGSLVLTETKPSTPPAIFSLKMYFGDQETLVKDYWGDWKITHYQSGAYHVQPGLPGSDGSRKYAFNAAYNAKKPSANETFALPIAFALLQGPNYTDNETAFMLDDISITPMGASLPKEPIGDYVRTQKAASPPPVAPTESAVGQSAQKSDLEGEKSYMPIIIGGACGFVVLLGIIGAVMYTRRGTTNSKNATTNIEPSDSQKGHVQYQPVSPNVQQSNVPASGEGSPHANENGEYYNGSGYVMVDAAAESSQRQMSFIKHYVPEPGQIIADDEVEGDDYYAHQQMIQNQYGDTTDADGYTFSAAPLTERSSSNPVNPRYSNTNGGDYFLAEEVMDDTETSQAVPIDHAYIDQAIGYHQAQLESRIRQDESMPLSPMLTLTGAGGEQVYLDGYQQSIGNEERVPSSPKNYI